MTKYSSEEFAARYFKGELSHQQKMWLMDDGYVRVAACGRCCGQTRLTVLEALAAAMNGEYPLVVLFDKHHATQFIKIAKSIASDVCNGAVAVSCYDRNVPAKVNEITVAAGEVTDDVIGAPFGRIFILDAIWVGERIVKRYVKRFCGTQTKLTIMAVPQMKYNFFSDLFYGTGAFSFARRRISSHVLPSWSNPTVTDDLLKTLEKDLEDYSQSCAAMFCSTATLC